MLTPQGPKLIEYNCRFGDPECQVLMMRFDGDLVDLLLATAEGRLAAVEPPAMARRTALTVVLAANGYPGTPEKGAPIALPLVAQGNMIFHAGTALSNGALVSSGGRVLSATATGDNVTQAQTAAYNLVDKIGFPGGFCRRDIGWRDVAREAASTMSTA
jgi:phosphoribosylamine--glycine ligase